MIKFPSDFLWGAATSAYQVEGGNIYSDWWPWEMKTGQQRSGQACRHYELYKQDFDLAQSLHHNSHRFSIEWARIESKEGEFSQQELQHYTDVILNLKNHGLEPLVTLHHFTNPIWFSASGGWESKDCVKRFLRYAGVVVKALAPYVHYWITINEPTIYFSHAYLFGWWPPQAKSLWKARAVRDHLLAAHIQAYRLIHGIYKELGLPKSSIGISHHMPAITTCSPSFINDFAVNLRKKIYNFDILDAIMQARAMDFIGLNYYSRNLVEVNGWAPWNLLMDTCQHHHLPVKKNSLGWDIYPQGLYQVLCELKKYHLPIMITENGICTDDDNLRWKFIREHLKNIHLGLQEGVDVKGYLYWSLLDNFEWDKGFGPRFGLIEVNYANYQRMVRESAKKFAQVCQSGITET